MACPSIVVIGASAGGLEAVSAVLGSLPRELRAAVFVVIHTSPDRNSLLPVLLGRVTSLPVRVPLRPERIRSGHVYLASPDCHLLIEDGRVRVTHGPRQHGFRPAVDPLFISAASCYRECVAGVVLSGALSDGTVGLQAIKRAGGTAIVQNPEEAAFPSMPLTALKNVAVDAVLPASQIGPHLAAMVANGPGRHQGRVRKRDQPKKDARTMKGIRPPDKTTPEPPGTRTLTPFTCPNCGGALWEVEHHRLDSYECHVGHRFGSDALVALGDERTENVLWSAVRALKEDAALRRRMAARASGRGMDSMAHEWLQQALDADMRAEHVRVLIEDLDLPPGRSGGAARGESGRTRAGRKPIRERRKRI